MSNTVPQGMSSTMAGLLAATHLQAAAQRSGQSRRSRGWQAWQLCLGDRGTRPPVQAGIATNTAVGALWTPFPATGQRRGIPGPFAAERGPRHARLHGAHEKGMFMRA